MRTWSNYGRLYLRHFNELDHELDARLNRAHEYADRYLSSFSSPLLAVVAKNILFITGGVLVLIMSIGIYDEYVFQVEHVLTIITGLSVIGLICRSILPDENLIWCPEQLMTAILAHVHYLPTSWKNQAHTSTVRKEFSIFFQFKAGYLLNEICSPLITPFVLLFVFRPKAAEIVKFFRSFTVTVRGVGNVCSFAQMDVRRHGSPEWQIQPHTASGAMPENREKKHYEMENGKTELSLVRFTLTNPEWQMPPEAMRFIKEIRENAVEDLLKTRQDSNNVVSNPITESLLSFGTIGDEYSTIASSVLVAPKIPAVDGSIHRPQCKDPSLHSTTHESDFEQMLQQNLGDPHQRIFPSEYSTALPHFMTASFQNARKLRVGKAEGRLEGPSEALLFSLNGLNNKVPQLSTNITVADMCLSALYLHEVHNQNKKKNTRSGNVLPGTSSQIDTIVSSTAAESTPLLENLRS